MSDAAAAQSGWGGPAREPGEHNARTLPRTARPVGDTPRVSFIAMPLTFVPDQGAALGRRQPKPQPAQARAQPTYRARRTAPTSDGAAGNNGAKNACMTW
jgi:hypothetical protein